MKKNHDIHLALGKDLKEKLQKEADEKGISLSEFCREKLKEDPQSTRIETNIDNLIKMVADFGKRSTKIRSS